MGARSAMLAMVTVLVLAVPAARAIGTEGHVDLAPADSLRTDDSTVWFQGYLADSVTGDPLTGNYNVVAAIYTLESGGAPVWGPETHTGTQVLEGWFHIELGSIVTPFLSFSLPPYYLQLTVNGEVLSPRQKLASVPTAMRVDGTAKVTSFEMATGATAGRVLTSDASGNGTWQPAAGTVGGGGTAGYLPKFTAPTTIGNSAFYETSGRVGLGTTTPAAGLSVVRPAADRTGLEILSSLYSSHPLVLIEKTGGGITGETMLSMRAPSYGRTGSAFISCMVAENEKFRVEGNGDVTCGRLSITNGTMWVASEDDMAAGNFSSNRESSVGRALRATFNPTGNYDGVAIEATSTPDDFYGVGGRFTGGWYGVEGIVNPTGSSWYMGSRGGATGGSGTNYGVYGNATGSGTNYGVYGTASGGSANYAGYFGGNVHITGTLTGGKAGMKIDHPLDPANEYLSHSFVGSSEMLDVYSGNATLDGAGESVVELPDWFEALNGDFRYQLTAIGAPGPNLYVAERVRGGRFAIAGGEPGTEVSWQITAVRRDPVAAREPMSVESPKPASEVGRYVNPEAHGQPSSAAVGYVAEKAK